MCNFAPTQGNAFHSHSVVSQPRTQLWPFKSQCHQVCPSQASQGFSLPLSSLVFLSSHESWPLLTFLTSQGSCNYSSFVKSMSLLILSCLFTSQSTTLSFFLQTIAVLKAISPHSCFSRSYSHYFFKAFALLHAIPLHSSHGLSETSYMPIAINYIFLP